MAIASTTLSLILLTTYTLLPTPKHLLSIEQSAAFAQNAPTIPSLETASLKDEQIIEDAIEAYSEAERLYDMGGAGWDGIQRYKSALTLLQSINAEPFVLEAELLVGLGDSYDALSNYQQGISYYQQALEVWQVLDNPQQEAMTWQKLGMSYESLKEREAAQEAYQKVLALYQEVGDRLGEEKTLQHIQSVQPGHWWLSKIDRDIVRKILVSFVVTTIGTYGTLKSLKKKK